MAIVTVNFSKTSYGTGQYDALFDSLGTSTLEGFDYGDIETGVEYPPMWLYLQHDGIEPIYSCRFFLRAVGLNWGGYVPSASTAVDPYNPNIFRSGGINQVTGWPNSSTADYETFRIDARDNPEMGVRLHLNRENELIRTNGLGHQNIGLSFNPISMPLTTMLYANSTTNVPRAGVIYPKTDVVADQGKIGDEAKVGISIKLGEDLIGGGFAQIGVSIAYRHTY